MHFDEYNGWPNYATWNAYTWLTSYQETANQFEQIAYQYQVQPALTALLIDGIQRGFTHEAYHGIVTDWLRSGIRWVEWSLVYDLLRGEPNGCVPNELSVAAYDAIRQGNWYDLVAQAQYQSEADSMLQDWMDEQITTWIESLDARRHTTSLLNGFALVTLQVYLNSVDWDRLTRALKGE